MRGGAIGGSPPLVQEARLVAGEAASVAAVPLPGGRHFVPDSAVEVDVVAPGLAGSGVCDVGVQRVAVVRELLRAVGSLDRADRPGRPGLAAAVPVTGGQYTAQLP
jgi:hypothetical protein